ncbi:MAG: hypothetical protein LUI07_08395 [Lachnospiraceae bacterium]|nr:hypothetical protein [Lachnospiraceae bacterium]
MNVARMIHLGMAKLGYTEREMFCMTPRKFFKMYDQFLVVSGVKKDGDEYSMDAMP